MAVRSALRAGRPLPPGRILVLISVRGWVDRRAIVWLEGLVELKNLMTSSGIETATFRLVASTKYATACPLDFYPEIWIKVHFLGIRKVVANMSSVETLLEVWNTAYTEIINWGSVFHKH
jgi:hypothetical protein